VSESKLETIEKIFFHSFSIPELTKYLKDYGWEAESFEQNKIKKDVRILYKKGEEHFIRVHQYGSCPEETKEDLRKYFNSIPVAEEIKMIEDLMQQNFSDQL